MRQYDADAGPGGTGRGVGSEAGDREPEEIRVEIAQTRTEMSGTIDAIQQRLAPEVLGAQAKEVARDATDHGRDSNFVMTSWSWLKYVSAFLMSASNACFTLSMTPV